MRLVRFEYENPDVIVYLMKGLLNLVVFALVEDADEGFVMYFDRLILYLIDQFYLRF
jgi:hypothetical protein